MSLTLSSKFLIEDKFPERINIIASELFSCVKDNINDFSHLNKIFDETDVEKIAFNIMKLSTSKQIMIQKITSNVLGKLVLVSNIIQNKTSIKKLIDLSKLLFESLTNHFKNTMNTSNYNLDVDSFYQMALKGLQNSSLQSYFIDELSKVVSCKNMFQPINTVDSIYEKSIYKSFLDNINDKNFEECLKLHLKVKFDNLDAKAKFLFFNHLNNNITNLKELFDELKGKLNDSDKDITKVIDFVIRNSFIDLLNLKKTTKLPLKTVNEYLYSIILNTFGLNNHKISFKQFETELKVSLSF